MSKFRVGQVVETTDDFYQYGFTKLLSGAVVSIVHVEDDWCTVYSEELDWEFQVNQSDLREIS